MEEVQLYVGLKLTDAQNISWRIISVSKIECILIRMHITNKEFIVRNCSDIMIDIAKGIVKIDEDQEKFVFDVKSLTHNKQEDYWKKKEFIAEIERIYGPNEYRDFITKKSKPDYDELLKSYGYGICLGNRMILRWFQSGFQDGSWMDPRFRQTTKKKCVYTKKPGRKNSNNQNLLITNDIKEQFDYGLEVYRNGRGVKIIDAYTCVLYRYYTQEVFDELKGVKCVAPQYRPTLRQFSYYLHSQIDKAEAIRIKTSNDEYFNDHRLLFGFNRNSAVKPGYIVEVDALEMDIYITSSFNREQTISRPIVYMMVDLYSHAIVAFHVGFDNNSMLGLSSLMMNLFDDKERLMNEHNIHGVDLSCWPSRFIPHEIRADRGSDFASDQFEIICKDLNIMRTLEHGATGSMKGLVEQSFRQYQRKVLPVLDKLGVIFKRYDSNHKKQACLTIEDIYEILVAFVIEHNSAYTKNFSLTKDMREKDVYKSAISIWNYGVENAGLQSPITPLNYESSIYHILPEGQALLTREGVKFKGLLYTCGPEDRNLIDKIKLSEFNRNKRDVAGRKLNSFDIKYDPRSVNEIYYLESGTVKILHIDMYKNDGVSNITWHEYENFKIEKGKKDRAGHERNMEGRVSLHHALSSIANNAITPTYADSKNIREFRSIEQDEVNFGNRVSKRLEKDDLKIIDTVDIEVESQQIIEEETSAETSTDETANEKPSVSFINKEPDKTCPAELCDWLDD